MTDTMRSTVARQQTTHTDIVTVAYRIAAETHKDAKRKYSGTPYVFHPIRVAGRVAVHPGAGPIQHAAAILHDAHEDPPYFPLERIATDVHPDTAVLVGNLTNPSKKLAGKDGKYPAEWTRAKRKELDANHLAACDYWTQVIKLYDRIDNLTELRQDLLGTHARPPIHFVELYCHESRDLGIVLGKADGALRDELSRCVSLLRSTAWTTR